jgi:hypothetical protein
LLSLGLLGDLLGRTLIPVTWLHPTSELLEGILWAIVQNSSSSSYRFNHLSGLGMLDSLSFVLLVGFREWWGDDHIQDAGCEAIQEEADGFFAPDCVTGASDEFFKVCNVLVYLWEAHLAFV